MFTEETYRKLVASSWYEGRRIETSPFPANQNNPSSSFNQENRGLHTQVMAHEQAHNEQIKEAIQQGGYKYTVNGKEVTGKLDKVTNSFYKALDKQIAAMNKAGFANEKAFNAAQAKINDKIKDFQKSMIGQIAQKVEAAAGGKVEDNANARAMSNLRARGENTNYITGQNQVIENGKVVPQN